MRITNHASCQPRRLSLAMAAIVVLAGCAAGPNFSRPAAPEVKRYTSAKLQASISAGASEPVQQIVSGSTVGAGWWKLFHSSALDQVVDKAIASSPNLDAARATLREAQQVLIETRGDYFPQVSVSALAQRGRTPGSPAGNLYQVGAGVDFVPDAFGATRRRVEQARAGVDLQQYQLAAAWLTLTGDTVSLAIDIASIRLQIQAAKEIIADDETNLRLVKLGFSGGKVAHLQVLTAESQLAGDRTLLAPLEQQLAAANHALSVLTGEFPGNWSPPVFELSSFALPANVPVSLPSAFVRQRPDILAAEASLHASSAAIGIAASGLYPSITLSGNLGSQALSVAHLFESPSRFWNLVASPVWTIFQGGALRARKRAAVDAFRASADVYRQTVLTAFQQVADLLSALDYDAQLIAAQKLAMQTSNNSLVLERASYKAGKSDLLQLLDAQRAYQQARLGYARAEAQRYQDTAQLFVAMGGGWWHETALK